MLLIQNNDTFFNNKNAFNGCIQSPDSHPSGISEAVYHSNEHIDNPSTIFCVDHVLSDRSAKMEHRRRFVVLHEVGRIHL